MNMGLLILQTMLIMSMKNVLTISCILVPKLYRLVGLELAPARFFQLLSFGILLKSVHLTLCWCYILFSEANMIIGFLKAVSFSNLYAPEHLIINVKDAEKWESFIENAGMLF